VHIIKLVGGCEWDELKARSNLRKHGIDFADVPPVFEDDRALSMRDQITAADEERFVTVGMDALGRVLVVIYAWSGSRIRLISARRAAFGERREYGSKRR